MEGKAAEHVFSVLGHEELSILSTRAGIFLFRSVALSLYQAQKHLKGF